MNLLTRAATVASIALLVLLAALPWGLPAEDRFFLPLLPVVAIHCWTLRHQSLVPEWAGLLAGLALDFLTNGRLGYWPLIYLAAFGFAIFSAPLARNGAAARLALLAAAILGIAAIGWAVQSIYAFEAAGWRPYAVGAAFAGLCAVPLLSVLRMLDAAGRERNNAGLARGV